MSPSADPNQEIALRVARLLRHEVGDLLQSVYTTTAVLLDRLAGPCEHERRLLSDLKSRAEWCKLELDVVVDLVSLPGARSSLVDLAPLVRTAMAQVRHRFPALSIAFEEQTGQPVRADAQGLSTAMTFLTLACCLAARHQVHVQRLREGDQVVCSVQRDGYPVTAEQLAWLDKPFSTTTNAVFGLALALTRRAVEPSGGAVRVVNLEGGIRVQLQFPITGR